MLLTRRKAEELFAARADVSSIEDRLAAAESVPRPPEGLDSLRETLGGAVEVVEALGEQVAALVTAHEELREGHKDLILAVSEGIERTERAERRVKATVKRARRQLAERGLEDEGLEAEDRELYEGDADRGGNGEMSAVRREVAPATAEASSVRGVTLETLRRFRGI